MRQIIGALADWLDTLRYDHPGVFRVLTVVVGVGAVSACFMLLPSSPLLRALGVTELQKRVTAATNGVYWSTRAAMNDTAGERQHRQAFGNVEGIDASGKLIIAIPQNKKWVQQQLWLANVEIVDPYGVAQLVGALRQENARFDIYEEERVVAWIRNTPLNVKLIEAGVAKPDPKPPTNIFDLAFATYYWGIARGRVY